MDHPHHDFRQGRRNALESTKQKVAFYYKTLHVTSHIVFKFFDKSLTRKVPQSPATIFGSGEDFDNSLCLPNSDRCDSVHVWALLIVVIEIAGVVLLRLGSGRLNHGVQLDNVLKVTFVSITTVPRLGKVSAGLENGLRTQVVVTAPSSSSATSLISAAAATASSTASTSSAAAATASTATRSTKTTTSKTRHDEHLLKAVM
jgi:hypothetical protein